MFKLAFFYLLLAAWLYGWAQSCNNNTIYPQLCNNVDYKAMDTVSFVFIVLAIITMLYCLYNYKWDKEGKEVRKSKKDKSLY